MPTAAPETVAAFLAALPPDRRRELERVRAVIRGHLPAGYEEVATARMLVYQVPLSVYGDTYNGHPLWYVGLASEKSYLSLHLMRIYGDPAQLARLKDAFARDGKKLDMGKACVRFRTADDLPLETIGELVGSTPVEMWVGVAKAARGR